MWGSLVSAKRRAPVTLFETENYFCYILWTHIDETREKKNEKNRTWEIIDYLKNQVLNKDPWHMSAVTGSCLSYWRLKFSVSLFCNLPENSSKKKKKIVQKESENQVHWIWISNKNSRSINQYELSGNFYPEFWDRKDEPFVSIQTKL